VSPDRDGLSVLSCTRFPMNRAEPIDHPPVDRRLWWRFVAMARPYWSGAERTRAIGLLALLIVLLLGQTSFNVLFNQQSGEFTSALAAGDAERFWRAIRHFSLLLVVAVPLWACYYFVRDTLGLRWRRWLTTHLLGRYLGHRAFYRLTQQSGAAIDNPDQRIAEDVNSFTGQSLYFLMVLLGALIELVAFTGVLWSISRLLVAFLIVYAVAGTWITIAVFGRPLIGLNFRQLRREADFRFGLVRLREHAEPIAFHEGEREELGRLRGLFASLYGNARQVLRWQFGLNLFQYGHSFLTMALPSIIIADQVLSGEMEVGRAIQAAGAFSAILGALTLIVQHFESLSRFGAGVNRLHEFSRALDRLEAGGGRSDSRIETLPGRDFALEHVAVMTPQREHLLIRDLSLTISDGHGLLIEGPSGCGKSSLLRAIAGLWTTGSGRIVRPDGDEVMFLPQHPYLGTGTLRDELLYPHPERSLPDEELRALLREVNLPDLADRVGGLDAVRDWAKVLSTGEQQRLAFARALRSRARFVILDEASSALDAANEALLYARLVAAGSTPVSISHRPALLAYHQQVLRLHGDGGWSLHPARSHRFGEGGADAA
jgi:putative ATP-binding cassette transporter